MITSSPYFRTFSIGAVRFVAVTLRLVSRHSGHWSTYPPQNFIVLIVAWVITALLLGVVATRFEKWRSWLSIVLGTMGGSLVVLGVMLFAVERVYGPPARPKFKSTDE